MLGKIHGKRMKRWRALATVLMAGPMPLCLSAPLTSPGAQAAPSATRPSFDCAKAQSSIESLICKDPELTQLDSSMANAYREAAKRIKPNEVAKLRQEQRRWIKQTRSLCLDATCLKQVYTHRTYILNKTKSPLDNITICRHLTHWQSQYCEDIIIYRDPNDRLEDFREYIKNGYPSWHMTGCSLLTQISLGGNLGNKLYTGYCILHNGSNKLDIIMQTDLLIGVSTITPDNNQPKDLDRIIDYIDDPAPIINAQGTFEMPGEVKHE